MDSVDSSVVVELTESDIPGAALSEPLEVHTVHALKWCLISHGIKPLTSWRKPQLMDR